VTKVEDEYTGVVKMLESGDVLRLDQDDLETVLPALGARVLVVNGADRGTVATLQKLLIEDVRRDANFVLPCPVRLSCVAVVGFLTSLCQYSAEVRLERGKYSGRPVVYPYEHICKLAVQP